MHWLEKKPLMIVTHLPLYLLEIQRQLGYAVEHIQPFLRAVNERNGHEAFRHLSCLLHFTNQAFHVIWPTQDSAEIRGRWIRVALGIKNNDANVHIRRARNWIAHRDVKLDDLISGKKTPALNFVSDEEKRTQLKETEYGRLYPSIPRFDDENFGRETDTYLMFLRQEKTNAQLIRVVMCGDSFVITDLTSVISDLQGRSETAIDEGRVLKIYSQSKGDIKKAEEALANE